MEDRPTLGSADGAHPRSATLLASIKRTANLAHHQPRTEQSRSPVASTSAVPMSGPTLSSGSASSSSSTSAREMLARRRRRRRESADASTSTVRPVSPARSTHSRSYSSSGSSAATTLATASHTIYSSASPWLPITTMLVPQAMQRQRSSHSPTAIRKSRVLPKIDTTAQLIVASPETLSPAATPSVSPTKLDSMTPNQDSFHRRTQSDHAHLTLSRVIELERQQTLRQGKPEDTEGLAPPRLGRFEQRSHPYLQSPSDLDSVSESARSSSSRLSSSSSASSASFKFPERLRAGLQSRDSLGSLSSNYSASSVPSTTACSEAGDEDARTRGLLVRDSSGKRRSTSQVRSDLDKAKERVHLQSTSSDRTDLDSTMRSTRRREAVELSLSIGSPSSLSRRHTLGHPPRSISSGSASSASASSISLASAGSLGIFSPAYSSESLSSIHLSDEAASSTDSLASLTQDKQRAIQARGGDTIVSSAGVSDLSDRIFMLPSSTCRRRRNTLSTSYGASAYPVQHLVGHHPSALAASASILSSKLAQHPHSQQHHRAVVRKASTSASSASGLRISWPIPPLTQSFILVSLLVNVASIWLPPFTTDRLPAGLLKHLPHPVMCSAPINMLRPRYGTGIAEYANAFLSLFLVGAGSQAGPAMQGFYIKLLLSLLNVAILGLLEDAFRRHAFAQVKANKQKDSLVASGELQRRQSHRHRRAHLSSLHLDSNALSLSLQGHNDAHQPHLWPMVLLCSGLWILIISIRLLYGQAFSRWTGWAAPKWFWSDSVSETGSGLAPLVFGLIVIQSLLPRAVYEVVFSGRQQPSVPQRSPRHSSQYLAISVPKTLLHALLAVSNLFLTPDGMTWWAISGLTAGALFALFGVGLRSISSTTPDVRRVPASRRVLNFLYRVYCASAVVLPLLATIILVATTLRPTPSIYAPVPSLASFPSSFPSAVSSLALSATTSHIHKLLASAHPGHDKLLTILLMTAPRPGHPDFLIRTLESYLANMPEPGEDNFGSRTALAGRVRIVVYTHFAHHPVFQQARDVVFADSPKAEAYVDWVQRLPLAPSSPSHPSITVDRLDQRLHLARALKHVTTTYDSAYVLLAEDDFPLCEDGVDHFDQEELWRRDDAPFGTWAGYEVEHPQHTSYGQAWNEMLRVLAEANRWMPDQARGSMQQTEAGHCGVFVGTGGSGLAVRSWLAERLPALLLGRNDTNGDLREARALQRESGINIPAEDINASPPDVVIQDCLLGNIEGCEACAAPLPFSRSTRSTSFSSTHATYSYRRWLNAPVKTAREPFAVPGDRWGKTGLVTSQRLLMRHLGHNASTVPDRLYKREEWGCGWRHPFNGDPSASSESLTSRKSRNATHRTQRAPHSATEVIPLPLMDFYRRQRYPSLSYNNQT
ncbi:hypothetical protein E5Q_01809 [Mixia osmundae IAM 14324]|uniref:Uncharacterized protein n=1 Tax=Mixia osmundae (strain CBS 9802 / IAM 14324 / JCM 22182 / KY 12970) TaxID=764103 RepID=G7DWP2_MIXOS|nr:hypothetical protein E5Q_01809 [Mixia osmundae IAM 14324]